MKIRAINDNVVVEEIKELEKTTSGGVIIPTAVVDQLHRIGTVISVGSLVQSVVVGDKIAYAKHGGQVMAIDEQKLYKVLKIGEVYCALDED